MLDDATPVSVLQSSWQFASLCLSRDALTPGSRTLSTLFGRISLLVNPFAPGGFLPGFVPWPFRGPFHAVAALARVVQR